jgi:phosphatidylglycerophosphate synthase
MAQAHVRALRPSYGGHVRLGRQRLVQREAGVDTLHTPVTLAQGHGVARRFGRSPLLHSWRRIVDGWRRAQTTAQIYPRLVASWKRTAAHLALAEVAGLALEAWRGDRQTALRAAPGVLLTWGATQGDTYLHLGMNVQERAAPPWDTLGLPVTLTLLRRTIAGFLWAHLLGGRPVRDRLILGTLLGLGATSDVLDGSLARRRRRVTRLGAYLDAEADGSFWLSLGLTFAARRILPRWFFALLCARFGVPVLAAAVSHAVLGRSPTVGSTVIGKAAAVAQLAIFSAALLSSRRPAPGRAVQRAYRVLQGVTAALLLAAPLAQVVRMFASPSPDTPSAVFSAEAHPRSTYRPLTLLMHEMALDCPEATAERARSLERRNDAKM